VSEHLSGFDDGVKQRSTRDVFMRRSQKPSIFLRLFKVQLPARDGVLRSPIALIFVVEHAYLMSALMYIVRLAAN
jgi:hypothetical protein